MHLGAMRRTVALIAAALAMVSAGELALRSGDTGKAQRRLKSLQREQAALEARLREVSSQLESLSSGSCALPDGDGPVASLALCFTFSPGLAGESPGWVYVLCAALLFSYQSLDGSDGKQARKTNSCCVVS